MRRAQVTSRVLSDPDHRGRRRLVATAGEVVTVDQARRRGIPEEVLAPVGPDARVSTSTSQVVPLGPTPDDGEDEDVEPSPPAGDGDAGGPGDDPYPRHRGGPNWELSDGSTVRGSREAAEAAERDLQATPDEGEGG